MKSGTLCATIEEVDQPVIYVVRQIQGGQFLEQSYVPYSVKRLGEVGRDDDHIRTCV